MPSNNSYAAPTQPPMSNRRRAMMNRQQPSPYSQPVIPDAVRSQMGGQPQSAGNAGQPDPFAGADPFGNAAAQQQPAQASTPDPFAGADPFAAPAPQQAAPAVVDPFAGADPFQGGAPSQPQLQIGGVSRPQQAVDPSTLKAPKHSIIDRIRNFFANHNASQVFDSFIVWVSKHELWFIIPAVLLIAIGLLVSRYISFGGAIVMLILGAAVNFNKEAEDSFAFYIYALVDFIIPYMF